MYLDAGNNLDDFYYNDARFLIQEKQDHLNEGDQ